jgi:tRNA(Ile)-lysidine synthase
MTTYIVAVSGGVDSVVLLDMLARFTDHQLVVAHFDHGIRPESADDAAFVRALAGAYGLPFETKRMELGSSSSEERARRYRYEFLRAVAEKYGGQIVTAHHADDVIETIAINLRRGTGWRGLAAMNSAIVRPLLHLHKSNLKTYARQHGLEWREDPTNTDEKYLRNAIRRRSESLPAAHKKQLLELHKEQRIRRQQIEKEVARLVGDGPEYSRYFFTHVPKAVALECLRHVTNAALTRPQLERVLLAVKIAAAGSTYQAGGGVSLSFTTRNFTV